jgi:[methyl-Co(III) methanol-specific corrinoid protein]:coenzyme M methyltransferase
MDLILDPKLMDGIVAKAAEWNGVFIEAALKAGADVITMVDSAASGDLISPSQYEMFALPHEGKAVESIREMGGMSVLHLCGDISRHLDAMLSTAPDGISVEQSADLRWARGKVSGKAALIGNVSPTTTLLWGRPDDVRREALGCLGAGVDVLAPGCGFAPGTPLENMRALRLLP